MALDDATRQRAFRVARHAASRASEYLRQAVGQTRNIRHKGAIDLVTEHDLASEEILRQELRGAFPDWGLLAEEGGVEGPTDPRWVVDPLDGTTNFAHGLPIFAVSIGLEVEGVVEVAVVEAPVLQMVWSAKRGAGATRNDQPIRVSATTALDQSLLATGFPYDIKVSPENNLAEFSRMQMLAQAVRRAGAATLDLAWLAEGSFDGYWEGKLKPWDWAAGTLLITEAGGRLSDRHGGPFVPGTGYLVASNGLIHDALLDALR